MAIRVPKGFLLGGVHCGLKRDLRKQDLTLVVSEGPAVAVGVYTQNLVFAAPGGPRPGPHAQRPDPRGRVQLGERERLYGRAGPARCPRDGPAGGRGLRGPGRSGPGPFDRRHRPLHADGHDRPGNPGGGRAARLGRRGPDLRRPRHDDHRHRPQARRPHVFAQAAGDPDHGHGQGGGDDGPEPRHDAGHRADRRRARPPLGPGRPGHRRAPTASTASTSTAT